MRGWYDFPNVKFSKMLSFYPVAEAHGLIYSRPAGENFRFAEGDEVKEDKVRKRKRIQVE